MMNTPAASWDSAGPDTCEFCHVSYHVEIGYYCADCDRPICPTCVVVVFETRTVLCPQCADAGGD